MAYSKRSGFFENVGNKLKRTPEQINNSEDLEQNIFNHIIKLNPSLPPFQVEGQANWCYDKEGYLVIAFKKLIGKEKFEAMAYELNKAYEGIDAHVVVSRIGNETFYSLRMNAKVALDKVIGEEPKPEQVVLPEDILRKNSLLRFTDHYPQYRSFPKNHLFPELRKDKTIEPKGDSPKLSIERATNPLHSVPEKQKTDDNTLAKKVHSANVEIGRKYIPLVPLTKIENITTEFHGFKEEQINKPKPDGGMYVEGDFKYKEAPRGTHTYTFPDQQSAQAFIQRLFSKNMAMLPGGSKNINDIWPQQKGEQANANPLNMQPISDIATENSIKSRLQMMKETPKKDISQESYLSTNSELNCQM